MNTTRAVFVGVFLFLFMVSGYCHDEDADISMEPSDTSFGPGIGGLQPVQGVGMPGGLIGVAAPVDVRCVAGTWTQSLKEENNGAAKKCYATGRGKRMAERREQHEGWRTVD